MDSAATAVVDVIAPGPARPNARAPAHHTGDEEASFDQHLAAEAAPNDTPKPVRTAPSASEDAAPADSGAPETPDGLAAIVAAPTPALIMLQAPIAPAAQPHAPHTPSVTPATAQRAPIIAPAPAPATQPTPPTTPPAPASTSLKANGLAQERADAPAASPTTSPAPLPAANAASAPAAAAPMAQTPAQPQQDHQPQQQQANIAAPAPIALPANAASAPPLQAAPIAPQAMRTVHAEAKPAPEHAKATPQPAATPQGPIKAAQPKAAQAAPSAPDFSAFALADAPEGAQQTQSGASPAANATQSATHAHQASAAEHAAARAAPAAAQVSREIIRRFDGGNTKFELRLDPPELGRVEVKLEVSRDHRVNAVISADNPQALSDLMRHARDLEQSLQAAGLDLGENGLSFDLRQGEEGSSEAERDNARAGGAGDENAETSSTPAPQTARLERWRGMRIDVMA